VSATPAENVFSGCRIRQMLDAFSVQGGDTIKKREPCCVPPAKQRRSRDGFSPRLISFLRGRLGKGGSEGGKPRRGKQHESTPPAAFLFCCQRHSLWGPIGRGLGSKGGGGLGPKRTARWRQRQAGRRVCVEGDGVRIPAGPYDDGDSWPFPRGHDAVCCYPSIRGGSTLDVCRGLKGGGGLGDMLLPEAFLVGWQFVWGCPAALAATVEGVAL